MNDVLRYPIARDVRVQIEFTGNVTREGVKKLIDLLECERDTFPTVAELEARSVLGSLEGVALKTDAGQRPCVHCSYIGERKHKMCDECLALWLEANDYDMSTKVR